MKHLKRDAFRLAGTYLIIIMVMSIGFSTIFYNVSLHELDRRPRGGPGLGQSIASDEIFESYFTQRAEESRRSLLINLLLVNLVTFIIGGLVSYLLAERTLQPIEENMEAQSQFVSDASHELRTPLTALRTANEVALRNTHLSVAEAKDIIKDNVDDIARLQDLTNSMLGLLKDDDVKLFQSDVSLQEVVGEAMNMVANQALAKDIAVEDETMNLHLRGNHQSLVQLFTILLDNAVKYSEHATTVHLTSEKRGNLAVIQVRDEGIGMDTDTLARIFTRFYRAEKSRTTSGYGLGLSIAKKIVKAHGGKITAKSTPGKGTTFVVSLPVAAS